MIPDRLQYFLDDFWNDQKCGRIRISDPVLSPKYFQKCKKIWEHPWQNITCVFGNMKFWTLWKVCVSKILKLWNSICFENLKMWKMRIGNLKFESLKLWTVWNLKSENVNLEIRAWKLNIWKLTIWTFPSKGIPSTPTPAPVRDQKARGKLWYTARNWVSCQNFARLTLYRPKDRKRCWAFDEINNKVFNKISLGENHRFHNISNGH